MNVTLLRNYFISSNVLSKRAIASLCFLVFEASSATKKPYIPLATSYLFIFDSNNHLPVSILDLHLNILWIQTSYLYVLRTLDNIYYYSNLWLRYWWSLFLALSLQFTLKVDPPIAVRACFILLFSLVSKSLPLFLRLRRILIVIRRITKNCFLKSSFMNFSRL